MTFIKTLVYNGQCDRILFTIRHPILYWLLWENLLLDWKNEYILNFPLDKTNTQLAINAAADDEQQLKARNVLTTN